MEHKIAGIYVPLIRRMAAAWTVLFVLLSVLNCDYVTYRVLAFGLTPFYRCGIIAILMIPFENQDGFGTVQDYRGYYRG